MPRVAMAHTTKWRLRIRFEIYGCSTKVQLINVDINARQIEKKYNRLDVCHCLRVSGAHQLGTLEYQLSIPLLEYH